jgi:hypothetical protein
VSDVGKLLVELCKNAAITSEKMADGGRLARQAWELQEGFLARKEDLRAHHRAHKQAAASASKLNSTDTLSGSHVALDHGSNLVQHWLYETYRFAWILNEGLVYLSNQKMGITGMLSITAKRKKILTMFQDLHDAWQSLVSYHAHCKVVCGFLLTTLAFCYPDDATGYGHRSGIIRNRKIYHREPPQTCRRNWCT